MSNAPLIRLLHDDFMASLATLSQPAEQPEIVDPSLDGDRIDYDTWLLPPKQLEPAEKVIRFCSVLAGPVVLVIELACVIAWIF